MKDTCFIGCECRGHAIEFERDDKDGLVYIYMWIEGFKHLTFFERLKMVWYMVINKPYMLEDYVISSEKATEIAQYLAKTE